MPTKLNRAGEQQNYVPAGNGDASGEYGDNATGSNKNFKAFKKPNNENGLGVKVKQNGDKPINAKPQKTLDDLKNSLEKTLGKLTPNGKKLLNQIETSNADPKYVSLIANLYETGNYTLKLGKNLSARYEYSLRRNIRNVVLGNESLDGSYQYVKGSVFYHESGHALDNTSKGNNKLWSLDYVSKKYNMNLQESVDDELKIFKDKNNFDKIFQEKEDYINQYLKENGYEKYKQEYDEIKTKIDDFQNNMELYTKNEITKKFGYSKKELIDKYYSGKITYNEYFQKSKEMSLIEKKSKEEYENKYPEYTNLVNKLISKSANMTNIRNIATGIAFKKYGDLSDMVQAVTGKQICGGHASNYFRNKRSQATECFAELVSAKAVNKESYEVLKKYIPRTIEIFEEIIGEIENG